MRAPSEADRLEAMALAHEARGRRATTPGEARSALAAAEALRRRARELRAAARAPLRVVRRASDDS